MTEANLGDMAGNMWSGFTYLANEIAVAGSINWQEATAESKRHKIEQAAERAAQEAAGVASGDEEEDVPIFQPYVPPEALSDNENKDGAD